MLPPRQYVPVDPKVNATITTSPLALNRILSYAYYIMFLYVSTNLNDAFTTVTINPWL